VRAHSKKTNLSLVNARKMKGLVNLSNNFMLIMVKPRNDVDIEDFKGFDLNFKSELVDLVNQYDEFFRN